MTSNSGIVAEEKAFLMAANKYTGYARHGFSIAAPHYSLSASVFLSKEAYENFSVLKHSLLRDDISAKDSLLWKAVRGLTDRHHFHDYIVRTDKPTRRIIKGECYYDYHVWYTEAAANVIGEISKAVMSGKGNEVERQFWTESLEPFVIKKHSVTKKPSLWQKLGLGTR